MIKNIKHYGMCDSDKCEAEKTKLGKQMRDVRYGGTRETFTGWLETPGEGNSESRLAGGEGASGGGKSTLGRRNRKCKGPEVRDA